ncbi:MAG: DUF2244 domain-containing protein [Gammaproteobacteria bacterium]|nr:DUF2244 domain-containing protein [Gammaproteobacteria bacterium]
MIERVLDPSGRDCHWVIRPNQSLSWRSAVRVYTTIALCVLGVGVFFVLHGYWPVLPIAGLEIIILGVAFYLCLYRSQIREVVTISADVVSVEKGRKRREQHWECPRAWARINIERAPIAWYPSHLLVVCQGKRIEIGRFLNEKERQSLAMELQGMVSGDSWSSAAQ